MARKKTLSYKRLLTKGGKLRESEVLALHSLDMADMIYEMHEMIWNLAEEIANGLYGDSANARLYVDGVSDDFAEGKRFSPGVQFHPAWAHLKELKWEDQRSKRSES